MVSKRVIDRRVEGAGRLGPYKCVVETLEAPAVSNTSSFSSSGQGQPFDETSFSPLVSISSQKPTQPFILCFLDHTGRIKVRASPFLQSRLEDLISFRFQKKFARILAEENPGFYIDSGYLSNGDTCGNTPGEPTSGVTQAEGAEEHSNRRKRNLSTESCPVKRRKSAFQSIDEPSSPGEIAIKAEASSGDEEEGEDYDDFVGAGIVLEEVRIDDDRKIWDVIETRLKQIQQENCKKIAKAWVKAKEPQKQTKYPYNGGPTKEEALRLYGKDNLGELSKPPWWCSTEGWQRGEGCRHKEPDHQKKAERLLFMKHMLDICPVADLQTSTQEIHSLCVKRPQAFDYLKEIYSLRRQQERFHRGEIDGSTIIHVEMPKVSPVSVKRGMNKSAETSLKGRHEHFTMPLKTTSMVSMPTAEIARCKLEDSGPGLVVDNYPPRIPVGEASNEMGLFNGKDMSFDAGESSQDHALASRADTELQFSSCGYVDSTSTHPQYLEPYQPAVKVESPPCSFDRIAQTPDDYQWPTPTATTLNPYGSTLCHVNDVHGSDVMPFDDIWNDVQGFPSNLGYTCHGMLSASLGLHDDYVFESAPMSNGRGSSIRPAFTRPPNVNMQSMHQRLLCTAQRGHLDHRKANLIDSTALGIEPHKLSLDN